MRRRIKWIGLVALFSLVSVSFAFAELSVRSVLEQMQAKFEKVKNKVQSVKMVAETEAYMGKDKVVTKNVVYQKGNKIRSETTPLQKVAGLPDEYLRTVTIFDGKDMWVISKSGVQRFPLEEKEIEQMKPISSMDWIKDLEKYITLKGVEQLDGRSCYVLVMDKPYKLALYIDTDLLDWIKMEQISAQREKVEIWRKDFAPIDPSLDFLFPRRVEMYVDGKLMALTTVKQIELNPPIKDSLFEVNTRAVAETAKSLKEQEDNNKPSKEKVSGDWAALERLGK